MNDIGISNVLAQMRAMRLQAQAGVTPPPVAAPKAGGAEFTALLKTSIDAVNNQTQLANRLGEAFEKGEANVDLAEVMVQMQKASLSFQAMTQVRNKLVQAYQEIMSMSI